MIARIRFALAVAVVAHALFPAHAAERAERFKRVVASPDGVVSVVSEGTVGTGTSHASRRVTLRYYLDGIDTLKTVIESASGEPLYPIFTRILYNPAKSANTAMVLGWSSYGSGLKTYAGWSLRWDENTIMVADWFTATMPRTWPTVWFDSTTLRVAVMAPAQAGMFDNPSGGVLIGSDAGQPPRQQTSRQTVELSLKGWNAFTGYPYFVDRDVPAAESLAVQAVIDCGRYGLLSDLLNQ